MLRILLERKKLLGLTFAVATVLSGVAFFFLPKTFEAEAVLLYEGAPVLDEEGAPVTEEGKETVLDVIVGTVFQRTLVLKEPNTAGLKDRLMALVFAP